jgi:hypothetical protein
MRTKNLVIGGAVLMATALLVFAAVEPNFSGKWILDKSRSFSNPAGLEQTLTIVHEGNQVKMETQLKTARGAQEAKENYTLDGKESEFTPAAPPNAKGKRKVSWLPNHQGIVINDETSVDGKVVSQVTRKWTLSADGKSLTVDYFFDDQRGSFEAKRVFNKVE